MPGFLGAVGGMAGGAIIGGISGGVREGKSAIVPGAIGGAIGGGIMGGALARAGGITGMAQKGLGWAGGRMNAARASVANRGMAGAASGRYGPRTLRMMANRSRSYRMGAEAMGRASTFLGSSARANQVNRWGGRAITGAVAMAGAHLGTTMMSSNGTSGRRRYGY